MAMGLVKGEGFAVDASVLEANASRYHGKTPDELQWTDEQRQRRAVAEYLAAVDAEAKTIAEQNAADEIDWDNVGVCPSIDNLGRVECDTFRKSALSSLTSDHKIVPSANREPASSVACRGTGNFTS